MADYSYTEITLTSGGILSDTYEYVEYTLSSGIIVVPDTIPPEIINYVPIVGTEIEVEDPLQFDVTDNLGEFRRIIIEVFFQSIGLSEVAHDGDVFRPYYAANSTRTLVSNGYRYVLNRYGGWIASPTVKVYAIDEDGNEGV